MPRKNLNVDGGIGGQFNKVRKRGSSSSSSSSLVRNYRLKRAVLVGKRGGGGGGGSSTPVPMWKMSSKSAYNSSLQDEKKYLASKGGGGGGGCEGKEVSVSARKLAANLWEINGGIFVTPKDLKDNLEDRKSHETESGLKKDSILKYSSNLEALALCWSDPSSSPVPEGRMMDQPDVLTHRRRSSTNSQKILRSSDCNIGGGGIVFNSLHGATSLMEVDPNQMRSSHGRTPRGSRAKNRLKDLLCALTTSKELLKVSTHVWRAEEQQPTSLSLISAMKAELDRACIHANKLIHDQKLNQREFDLLVHHLEEEKTAWKIKEKERVRTAIAAVAGDLEIEKKLKRQTERLNKKLGMELADTKAKLMSTLKELECEKRAREILEQVCDELATGIGEDRAKVEELKRESAKVREEVEKEREMLQLADVLREERVQMKLSEAKYQFEEKNAVVEKLRSELESYLKSKVGEEQVDGSPNYARIKELEQYLRETLPVPSEYKDQENIGGLVDKDDQEEEEEDSADSDLHSIELNMDENSKSYKWSDVHQEMSKEKTAVETKNKTRGRKSTSDKRQRQSISIERETSDGIEWEFSPIRLRGNPDILDGRKQVFEFSSQAWGKECEDEIERYNMIKDLRDHIVSGSRMMVASSQEAVSSPNENWNQHILPPQNPNRMACEGFTVLQEAV